MGQTMRIGGLASGLDVDELVEKLMSAERAPLDKLEQQKQTYEWTRDAYRNVYTQFSTLDTYIADNLVLKNLITKSATSSNSAYVDATATGSANGTLTIEGVSQLAEAARSVGSQVNAIGTTTLKDLLGENVSQNYIEIRAIQKDGTLASTATKIEFTLDMTVNDFVSKINKSNAGVTAVFENGRMSITAKNTGDVKGSAEIVVESGQEVFEKFGFTLTGTDSKELANNGKNAIFQVNGIATERASNSFSINGYSVTLKNTFNSNQTIAKKFTAAQSELNNAIINYNNKEVQYNEAKSKYYNDGTDIEENYTNSHNSTYVSAFEKTLTLSEQEVFNKLNGTFWKNLSLSSDEINFIQNNKSDLKAAIDNIKEEDPNFEQLKSLTGNQIEALVSLAKDNNLENVLNNFKNYANYKELNADTIATIKKLNLNVSDLEDEINNATSDDTIKTILKTFTTQDETGNIVGAGLLNDLQEIASAEELKANYSTLGDTFLSELTNDEISKISNIDFTQSDPYSILNSDNDDDKKLIEKLKGLTDSQRTALDNLSEDKLKQFRSLAEQNINRMNYTKSKSEFSEANTRKTNAENTFQAAKDDADRAGILIETQTQINNPDGTTSTSSTYSIDPTVESTPSTNAVQITSSTNVDDIVSKIKEFVNTYNGLITQLNTLVKEKKSNDYLPLTDAQRKEMNDDEIKKWETQAKVGLLRNDSILQNVLTSARSLVYESNPAVSNSKYNTLYSIGITTSKTYTDGGTLSIDENKLRAALEDDPDAVATLFTNSTGKKDDTVTVNGVTKTADTRGFLTKLRAVLSSGKQQIEKKAGLSTMAESSYTLGKTLLDIKERIYDWKDRLKDIEDRYWKQFSSLETAVNKWNAYSSYFTQTS